MTTKNEGGADEDVILEDLPDIKDGDEDTTDWKAEAQKRHGIAQRLKTKLAKKSDAPEAKPKEGEKPAESKGLDRIDKAVLRAEKITDSEEVDLVESIMKETGKDLESVLESKYFKAELKELRELNATKDATPEGSKRSGTSTRDTVDYWIAKGELPPATDPVLRQKVVNAKIAKEKSGSQFSSNPIQ